jgi:hypothetical protein
MIKIKAYKCKLPVELRDESDRKCTQCKQVLEHEFFEYKSDGVSMYKMCNCCRGRRTKQWKEHIKQQELHDTPTYTEDDYSDDEHDGFTYGTDFYKDAMEILNMSNIKLN